MIQFDVILSDIGGHGLAQIIMTLMLAYVNLPGGFNGVFTVFGAYKPEYRCNVPPLDDQQIYPNLTETDILNLTTPINPDGESYNTCYRYGFNLSECVDGELSCVNQSYTGIKCDQGFYYDRSLFDETVVTEFDLVCDNRHWEALSSSLYYVGMLVGSLLGGYIGDAFGRRTCCILCYTAVLGCTFGMAFSRSFALYITLRSILGGVSQAAGMVAYVYIMEIIGRDWRTIFAIGSGCYFALGYMILSGVAYYWNNWHEMMFVCAILGLPFFAFILILPESPRWLFAKGKEKEGRKVVEKMARVNKREISEETWLQAKKEGEEYISAKAGERTYSYLDLFRPKRMRWITLNVAFNWCVNSFVYYGIALNAGALAGDIFINNLLGLTMNGLEPTYGIYAVITYILPKLLGFALFFFHFWGLRGRPWHSGLPPGGVLDIAAHIFNIALINRVGRRLLLASTLLLAGGGLLICVIVNNYAGDNQSLITFGVVLAFVAKFGISSSFSVIYALTVELYPTVVRSNGIGLGSTTARIGGIVAPFLISLQDYAAWLPNTIFGVFGVAAGLLSFAFPETNGRPMMETVEEAEVFYATHKGKVSKCSEKDDPQQLSRL